jgi:hypothetical protein
MSFEKKAGGALFTNNERKHENSPHYTGKVELDKEMVKDAVDQINNGAQFAELSVSGWNNVAKKTGVPFIGLKASKKQERDAVQGNTQPAPHFNSQPAPPVSDDKIPF